MKRAGASVTFYPAWRDALPLGEQLLSALELILTVRWLVLKVTAEGAGLSSISVMMLPNSS